VKSTVRHEAGPEVDKGGHFAPPEQPELFSAEIRAAFRSLR
jgi:pimeloyl-ACP methyl ester carboxylesterase